MLTVPATESALVVPTVSQTLQFTGQQQLSNLTLAMPASSLTHDGRSFARSTSGLLLPA